MKWLFRWLRRLLLLIGVLALLAALFYFLALPPLARAQVEQMFRQMGIADVQFELRRVTLEGIDLAAIRIGQPPRSGIESLRVTYTIDSLWHGRIKTVEVDQINWHITVRDGAVDFGLTFPAPAPTATARQPAASADQLPFDRITAQAARVFIDYEGQPLQLLGDLTLNRVAAKTIEARLTGFSPDFNANVQARGRVDLSGLQPSGDVTAVVPAFVMTNSPWLRRLMPALQDADFTGTFAVDAQLHLEQGVLAPMINVTATHLQAQSDRWPVAIDSASAAVTLTSLAPIATAASQRIDIDKARVGELEIEHAAITFTLQSQSSLRIEQATWSMREFGQFAADPFTLNPAKPAMSTRLSGSDIELGPWLNLLTSGRANANGLLAGSVAISIDPESPNLIQLGEGTLQGQPNRGWVQVQDAQLATQMLDQVQPPNLTAAQWQQVKKMMREALADYEYTMLRVDFIPEQTQLLCRIQTSGQGRKGPDPLQFGLLTINVHDFNGQLNEALLWRTAFNPRE